MIDHIAMHGMLRNMETAAEDALRCYPAFHEALQALKWEVDRNSRVQSAIRNLQRSGNEVSGSLVPRVKIRIRTSEGVISLDPRGVAPSTSTAAQATPSTQELRDAASSVIIRSRHREELYGIVNEAIGASDRFEEIASEIEGAGHEVVVCLDLLAYAQVRVSSPGIAHTRSRRIQEEHFRRLLSAQDLEFLRDLKITAVEGSHVFASSSYDKPL